MGIRGHIQTTQPEYEGKCISSWISDAAYEYLTRDAGLTIYTDNNGADADHWEIEISDFDRIKEVAKHLHEHPDAMDKYFLGDGSDDDFTGHGRGEDVANWLDCGIEVAEKKGYWTISIDWF